MTGPPPTKRTMLTIYAPFDAWLVKLAEGWRLCGMAPVLERGWSVLMYRWEQPKPRVAYRGIGELNHR